MPGMPDSANLVNFWYLEPTGDHCGRLRDRVTGALGTFTRATAKTVYDPTTGRIHDVPAGCIAAIPFAGLKTGGRGWAYSIEEARTNYLVNSYGAASTGGLWDSWGLLGTKTGTPATTSPVSSVYGFSQRMQYTWLAADAGKWLGLGSAITSGFAPGESVVGSLYVSGSKSAGTLTLRVAAFDAASAYLGASTSSAITLTTTPVRVSQVYSSLPANTAKLQVYIYWQGVSTGDTIDITIDAAQLEKGAFATSYIPTTTAAATRNADVLAPALAGIPVAAGTIIGVGYSAVGTGVKPKMYLAMTSGDVKLAISTLTPTATVSPDGSATSGVVTTSVAHTAAVTWAANALKAYTNGTAGTADTSVTAPSGAVASALIGSDGINYRNGYLGPIAVYSTAKTDAEVATASTAMEYGYARSNSAKKMLLI